MKPHTWIKIATYEDGVTEFWCSICGVRILRREIDLSMPSILETYFGDFQDDCNMAVISKVHKL